MASNKNLQKVLNDIAKKQGYFNSRFNIKEISSGGANYTSNLYEVTITEPLKDDLEVFAKIANLGAEFRATNTIMSDVYKLERIFYTELSVNFERIYNKNNVPEEHKINIPKCYGYSETELEETLVFENLSSKGYKSFDRMKTFDWEYASRAVEQLAKFHALGVAFREENPEHYENLLDTIEMDFAQDSKIVEVFFGQSIKIGTEYMPEEYRKRMKNFFSSFDMTGEMAQHFNGDKTLLVHGDFRPSNLMHRRKNGRIEIIVLDFQTYRRGNPVLDLMHLIFSGSDENFRRLYFDHLLEHYYTQLTLELQRLQIKVEDVYPRTLYKQNIKDLLPFGMVLALSLMPILTVDPDDAPKIDSGVDAFAIAPNDRALERLGGIARDFIRWGVL